MFFCSHNEGKHLSFVKCGNMRQVSNFTGIPKTKIKKIVFEGEGPLVRKGSTQQPKLDAGYPESIEDS